MSVFLLLVIAVAICAFTFYCGYRVGRLRYSFEVGAQVLRPWSARIKRQDPSQVALLQRHFREVSRDFDRMA